MSELIGISPHLFLYSATVPTGMSQPGIVNKIVSPDYFIHMNVTQPLNLRNRFASYHGLDLKRDELEQLPFP